MNIDLKPDYPMTDEACKAATGKTFGEWADAIGGNPDLANKRRDAIQWVADTTGRTTEGIWWATTIWVEYEKRIGRVAKDGRPDGYHLCCTKSISAPVEQVQKALEAEFPNITRVRDGKDIRATWRTPGVDHDTEIEAQMTVTGNKVGININHKRIPDRPEADGMRAYWATRLAEMKAKLEG